MIVKSIKGMTDTPNYKYSVDDFTVSITTEEYIKQFRDVDKFMEYCRQCHNYNRLWVCPPFNHNLDKELCKWKYILLTATQITPETKDIPLKESGAFIRAERKRLESKLLEMERKYGGRSFAFAGNCLYCPEDTCTRLSGLPCRHPDLVRPSLEAYGFNLYRTASELFGIEMLWSKNEFIPDYLTLVCGLFHNSPELTIKKEN